MIGELPPCIDCRGRVRPIDIEPDNRESWCSACRLNEHSPIDGRCNDCHDKEHSA